LAEFDKVLIRAGEDVRLLVVGGTSSATSTTTTASASGISGAGMVKEVGPRTGIRRPCPVEEEDE
jgi:hypothetical protein